MTFTQFFKRKRGEDSYLGTQLSPHKVRNEADGSLIARAVICRSGFQTYSLSELGESPQTYRGQRGGETVEVFRPPAEVLSPAFIASCEGVVLTDEHPRSFVSPQTFSGVARGHIQNVARGPDIDGQVTLEADLHVKDQSLLDAIAGGQKEISVGYLYELSMEGGQLVMRNLKANHCAIVPKARAGEMCAIVDSAPEPYRVDEKPIVDTGESFEKMLKRFHRQDPTRVALDDFQGLNIKKERPWAESSEDGFEEGEEAGEGLAHGNAGPMGGVAGGAVGAVAGGALGAVAGPEGAALGAVAGGAAGSEAGETIGSAVTGGHETSGDDSMPEECSCGAAENGSHMKGCKMYGKDAKKCMCDAEDDEQGAQHHKRCPKYFAGEADPESGTYAEDDAADPDQSGSARAVPPRVRGAGPDLIPVTTSGGQGNTNPVARDAYIVNVQALENLRALKPAIVAHARRTGDQSGVEHFNRAVVGLKREIGRYESQGTARPSTQRVQRSMTDADAAREAQRKIADDFDAAVRAARAACLADTHGFRTGGGARVAVDAATSRPKDEVSFEDQIAQARRVALGK